MFGPWSTLKNNCKCIFTLSCFLEMKIIDSLKVRFNKNEKFSDFLLLSTKNPIKSLCKNRRRKAKQSDKTYSIYSLFLWAMTWVRDAFYKVSQIVTQFRQHETLSRWMTQRIRGKRRWFRDIKSRCSYDTESILTLSTFWARTKRNLIFAAKSF